MIFYPSSDIHVEWQRVKPLGYHYLAVKGLSEDEYIGCFYDREPTRVDMYEIYPSVPYDTTSDIEIYINFKAKGGSVIGRPSLDNPDNTHLIVTLGYKDNIIDDIYISQNYTNLNTEISGSTVEDGTVIWAFRNLLQSGWSPLSSYVVGDTLSQLQYPYSKKWVCITSGVSGSIEPIWPTERGDIVLDGDTAWALENILTFTLFPPASDSSDVWDTFDWKSSYDYIVGDVPQVKRWRTSQPEKWVCINSGTSGITEPIWWAWKDFHTLVFLNQPNYFHHYHSQPTQDLEQEFMMKHPQPGIPACRHTNIIHGPPPAHLTDNQIINEINYISLTAVLMDPGSYLFVDSLSIEVLYG